MGWRPYLTHRQYRAWLAWRSREDWLDKDGKPKPICHEATGKTLERWKAKLAMAKWGMKARKGNRPGGAAKE